MIKFELEMSNDNKKIPSTLTILDTEEITGLVMFESFEEGIDYIYDVSASGEVLTQKLNELQEFVSNEELNVPENMFYYPKHKEEPSQSAYYLTEIYFMLFDKNYIDEKNWFDFLDIFRLNPKKRENVWPDDKRSSSGSYNYVNYKDFFSQNELNVNKINMAKNDILDYFQSQKLIMSRKYECENSLELFVSFISDYFNRNRKSKKHKRIMRCEHCGSLFLAGNITAKYCNRTFIGNKNKTCKSIMKGKVRIARKENDPTLKIESSTYFYLYSRQVREEFQKKLIDFFNSKEDMRRRYEKNEISEKEFINWLNSWKKN